MKKIKLQKGFTLIELMITVAIIGILASVAYPSYSEYVNKSRRVQAKKTLVAAQQWMERFYTENFRYDKNSANVAVTDASQFPSRFSVSPPPGEGSAMYTITVTVTDGVRDVFKVNAVRKAGSAMENDRCGDLSIDHLNRRIVTNHNGFGSDAAALDYCWR